MTSFENRIREIVGDRAHGSSTLAAMIVEAFRGKGNPPPDPSQVTWGLQQLRQVDPSMVVIHHLLDELEACGDHNILEALDHYDEQWRDIDRKLAGHLLRQSNWDNGRLLTHSHSGILLSVIRHLHEASPSLEVWQTISEPGGEGRLQYQALTKAGITCHLVTDEQALSEAPQMDAALFGVDQYSDREWVNKRGTANLVTAIVAAGKPVYVLGDSRKRVDRATGTGELFESIPFCNGVHLVTESGVAPARITSR